MNTEAQFQCYLCLEDIVEIQQNHRCEKVDLKWIGLVGDTLNSSPYCTFHLVSSKLSLINNSNF